MSHKTSYLKNPCKRKITCNIIKHFLIIPQDCIEIAAGGCSLPNATTDNATELPTTTNLPTTEPPSTDLPITEDPICGFFDIGNVPNPNSCTEYYLCIAGMALPQSCPDMYEFDPVISVSFALLKKYLTPYCDLLTCCVV